MADKKVSELGVASALDGSVVLPVVQDAASKQVATKEVAKFGYQDIQSATYDFIGYIDEVRITKGVARNRRSYKLPGLPMANF